MGRRTCIGLEFYYVSKRISSREDPMSRTIESLETDAFAAELVTRALSSLPDGPLEKLVRLIDWEQFRAALVCLALGPMRMSVAVAPLGTCC